MGIGGGDARIRVLFLLPSLRGGGAERVAALLARHCDPARFDIRLGLLAREGAFLADVDAGNIISAPVLPHLFAFEHGRASRPGRANRLIAAVLGPVNVRRLIVEADPHVVVSFVLGMCLATFVARAFLWRRRPRWIAREGTNRVAVTEDDIANRIGRGAMTALVGACYRSADCVLTISHDMAQAMGPVFRLEPDRIETIHNPIEVGRVQRLAKAAAAGAPQRPFIVTAGRLEHQKGLDLLIRAFAHSPACATRDLVILGEGSQGRRLRALAEALGVAGRVHFAGFTDNPWAYFARAELFVLASRWEGFGNVVAEAMACGAPVLVTDCDYGPREIVAHGTTGWVVPAGTAEALRGGLETLLSDAQTRNRLAAAGARRALDFDAPVVAARYAALFEAQAGRTSRR